jgi:hypothetical protein
MNKFLTLGRSSRWLDVAFGGLDGWYDGRGSPTSVSSEGRA